MNKQVFGKSFPSVIADFVTWNFNEAEFIKKYNLNKDCEEELSILKGLIETVKELPESYNILNNNYNKLCETLKR